MSTQAGPSVAPFEIKQVRVFAAIQRARQRLPIPLRGIDSDSGSEFINGQLYRTALRRRPPSPAVGLDERTTVPKLSSKIGLVVRRAVGYGRYGSPEQLDLLNTLYARLHFYVNFLLPVMKLEEKIRIGSRVKPVHDDPLTRYARVLASSHVSDEEKAELREAYGYLDLVLLRRRIDEVQKLQVHSLSSAQ